MNEMQTAFSLGLMIIKHLEGIAHQGNEGVKYAERVQKTLEEIANGELTLQDTPEEFIAKLPPIPPDIASKAPEIARAHNLAMRNMAPEMVRTAILEQREVAKKLLQIMRSPKLP